MGLERRPLLRRWVLVFVGIGLVAASCSSDGDAPESSSEGPEQVETDSLVDPLLELSDGDVAAAGTALLVSIDRGYRFGVVAAAIEEGRFTLDGVVLDGSGEPLAPSGTDGGYVVDKTPLELSDTGALPRSQTPAVAPNVVLVAFMQRPSTTTEEVESVIDREAKRNAEALGRIANLLSRGFSPEQVVSAFIFGDRLECSGPVTDRVCRLSGELPQRLEDQQSTSSTSQGEGDQPGTTSTDVGEGAESAGTIATIEDGTYTGSVDTSSYSDSANFETSFTFTKSGDSYEFNGVVNRDFINPNSGRASPVTELWQASEVLEKSDEHLVLALTITRQNITETSIRFDLVGNELVMFGNPSIFRVAVEFE